MLSGRPFALQQDPGLAVRAGRMLRQYHYKRLGLDPPEHGRGHFHHPMRNFRAAKKAKRLSSGGGEQAAFRVVSPLQLGFQLHAGGVQRHCRFPRGSGWVLKLVRLCRASWRRRGTDSR